MLTQEIPREQWSNFFDSFNRQHEGWLATLEIFAADAGAQREARDLPFEGISIDRANDESESVIIDMGKSTDDHVSRVIDNPIHIWLQKTETGADAAVEIEANDESRALLRFRSPMPPELVDGIVQE